tara:strand:- start:111 stop:464 length:354 start_codon:yes stop_codon:yes gene_type:complete
MYDYSIILSYKEHDDTIFRKELLQCFKMTEYLESGELRTRIDALYEIVSPHYSKIIQAIQETNNLALLAGGKGTTKRLCFMLLFSWDYFHDNHNLLNAINNGVLIDEMTTALLDKIY